MIQIRLQQIADAKRFYQILSNPHFIYFTACPASIAAERKWLRGNRDRIKNNTEWNYSILKDGELIGGVGVKINFHRNYIGEIGYFLDEKYWGQGIATQAVKLIEDICFNKLKLSRVEILMDLGNIGSEKVAIKNNYLKEGLLKKYIKGKDGTMKDCWLYAKVP